MAVQLGRLSLWLVIPLALAALLLALTAAFVRIGGRSADLWLRDLLHYAARPHQLVWRNQRLSLAEPAPSTWVEAPLPLTWAPRGAGQAVTQPTAAAE